MLDAKIFGRRIPVLIPAYRRLKGTCNLARSLASPFIRFAPAGHFYSPLPDLRSVPSREALRSQRASKECGGIDLREDQQLKLLRTLGSYCQELPFRDEPNSSTRYHLRNPFFSYGDAIILYGMLRHFQPGRVIEIGSGFSSAVMLDTLAGEPERIPRFTFIDPYPDRLLRLLRAGDRKRCEILPMPVQEVPLARYDELSENDLLFVDSSHVGKVGSDVNRLVFEVLPRLRPGVIVHFHDVSWPFDYPREWLEEGRAWNEAYLLRAFLQFNSEFEILYFNSFMARFHASLLEQTMPLCLRDPGSGLWLRRRAAVGSKG